MSWILPSHFDADNTAAQEVPYDSTVKVDKNGRGNRNELLLFAVLKLFISLILSQIGTHEGKYLLLMRSGVFFVVVVRTITLMKCHIVTHFLLPVLHHHISREFEHADVHYITMPSFNGFIMAQIWGGSEYFHHFVCNQFYREGNVKIAAFN